MGLIRTWQLKRRADRVLDALNAAAQQPALYRDPRWQARARGALVDLLTLVPMPPAVRVVMNNLLKNWKTTVLGLGAGFGIAVLQSLQGGLGLKDALIAAGLAAIGLAAKDSTVSGT